MRKFVLVLCLLLYVPVYLLAAGEVDPVPPDTSEGEGVLLADAEFWIGRPDQSSSMVLLVISAGKKVKVSGEYREYYEVWHRNLIGYIAKESVRLLSAEGEERPAPARPKVVRQPEPEKKKEAGLYRVTRETSLRTGPDAKEQVILRFRVGDRVEILDDSGYWWWKVRFDGKTGWAKKALLERL